MGKYYAVRKGLEKGIFLTWKECQEKIKGVSGAEYKSFKTEGEAKKYLENKVDLNSLEDNPYKDDESVIHAYVDGSYNIKSHEFSCGVVIVYGDEIIKLSQKSEDLELASMRNVAGEILGAEIAMQWFYDKVDELKEKKLIIYHDYEGIAKWALGLWEAKKPGTINYVEKYNEFTKKIEIGFVKVKAHSGNKYNDLADELAKNELGIKTGIKKNKNYILKKRDLDFCKYTKQTGSKGWASFFHKEGKMLVKNGEPIIGKEKIQHAMEGLLDSEKTIEFIWKPIDGKLANSGELGYTYGSYSHKYYNDAGEETSETGSYITIWEKDESGEYYVSLDLGN